VWKKLHVGREGERARRIETAVPARNFTITTAERVRAAIGGPPAWVLRRRRIEDLEDWLVQDVREVAAAQGAWPTALTAAQERKLAETNRLVDAHNRYYPIEADLPLDPRSGRTMERGAPWTPMKHRTAGELLARARAAREDAAREDDRAT
jgi:hypothetical protein